MARKTTKRKSTSRRKGPAVPPEKKAPKQVSPHSEQWRDVVVAVLGIVLVVALIVLYFLLKG